MITLKIIDLTIKVIIKKKYKYVSSPLNLDKEAFPQQNNYEKDNNDNI